MPSPETSDVALPPFLTLEEVWFATQTPENIVDILSSSSNALVREARSIFGNDSGEQGKSLALTEDVFWKLFDPALPVVAVDSATSVGGRTLAGISQASLPQKANISETPPAPPVA